jgi:hypothetical protein
MVSRTTFAKFRRRCCGFHERGAIVRSSESGTRSPAKLKRANAKAQAELRADGTLAALAKEWLGDGARLPS